MRLFILFMAPVVFVGGIPVENKLEISGDAVDVSVAARLLCTNQRLMIGELSARNSTEDIIEFFLVISGKTMAKKLPSR